MLDFQFSKDVSGSFDIEDKQNFISFRAGKIVRVFGGGSKNICANFLSKNRNLPAAWIDSELQPFPADLQRADVNWEKVLFIYGEEEKEWALKFLISARTFPILIFRADHFDGNFFPSLRERLIRSNSMLILISNSSSIGKWIDEDFFAFERNQLISLCPQETK